MSRKAKAQRVSQLVRQFAIQAPHESSCPKAHIQTEEFRCDCSVSGRYTEAQHLLRELAE